MLLREINVKREDDFGYGKINPEKPLIAKVKIEGDSIEQTLTLSPALSARIIELIREELINAAHQTAALMTQALEATDYKVIEAPKSPDQDFVFEQDKDGNPF